ncbi:MAG: hypothetical protein RLN83_05150 [Balneola sp.]
MSKDNTVTIDPENYENPTKFQIGELLGKTAIDPKDYANEQGAKMLFLQYRNTLMEKNNLLDKITVIEERMKALQEENEQIRVKNVQLTAFQSIQILNIPISALFGFSLNLLISDYTNSLGYILFLLSVALFVIVYLIAKKMEKSGGTNED